jgi:branched-subunit amino acid transport protein
MSYSEIWFVLILGGVLTFLIRLSFIVLLGKFNAPLWLTRALRFVPTAVLTAIIVPDLVLKGGAGTAVLAISPTNARLIAGMIAIAVAWRTKNALITIGVGMAALLLLRFVFNL